MASRDEVAPSSGDETVWLDSFLAAAAESVATARKVLRDQHIADLPAHWKAAPAEGSPLSGNSIPYQANVVHLQIRPDDAGDERPVVLKVPTAALIQQNSLVLDTVSLDIECTITEFVRQSAQGQGRIALRLDNTKTHGAPVRLSLQFKASDTPEGVARIGDFCVRAMT